MPRAYKLNLDFDWRFFRGDVNSALENSHFASYNSAKTGTASGAAGKDFSDEDWETVTIPHDAFASAEFDENDLLSHGYRKRTVCWYRKSFSLPKEAYGSYLLLQFDGIAPAGDVWFNGSHLGRIETGYIEYSYDITDRALFGEDADNLISIRVDGTRTEGWWYEGAGLYRHAAIFVCDPVHFSHNNLSVTPVLKNETLRSWSVEVNAAVENSAFADQDVYAVAELWDGEKQLSALTSKARSIPAGGKTVFSFSLRALRPKLWSPESPYLYSTVVKLFRGEELLDQVKLKTGFRTIAADPEKGFLLNGKQYKLKGVCCHQDHAGVGVAIPDSVLKYRVSRLKEMGCNAYRSAHNAPSPVLLDLCDEMGLIVMDENRHFDTSAEVLDQLVTLVKRDRNHPCVAFWSLFNEEPLQNTNEGRRIFRRMKQVVQSLDSSRLITGAINGTADGAGLEMDVVGINYNVPTIAKYHEERPGLCFIGSENCSAFFTRGCVESDREHNVLADNDRERAPWGQGIAQTWKFVYENDWMAGAFVWTGFDYRGEPTPFRWPSVSTQFGLLDTCGFFKNAAWYQKAFFDTEPFAHICTHWNRKAGENAVVSAATNCDEAELFLNGTSLGRQEVNSDRRCDWIVPFEAGKLTLKAYAKRKCVAEDSVSTSGELAALRLTPATPTLTSDGLASLIVNVEAIDSNGRFVPTANETVHFSVSDSGILRGVGNGDPNSHESDVLPLRRLFNGLCQVILTPTAGAERISLSAETDSGISASAEFILNPGKRPLGTDDSVGRIISGWRASPVKNERPDPASLLLNYSDYDMNSFMPVSFSSEKPIMHRNGWQLFMTRMSLPRIPSKLFLTGIMADNLEIWIDGNLAASYDDLRVKQSLSCAMPAGTGGESFIAILLKAGEQPAGILGSARIMKF